MVQVCYLGLYLGTELFPACRIVGKDRHELKLEQTGLFFSSFRLWVGVGAYSRLGACKIFLPAGWALIRGGR